MVRQHFPELVVVVEEEVVEATSSWHLLARVGHPAAAFAVSVGLLEEDPVLLQSVKKIKVQLSK